MQYTRRTSAVQAPGSVPGLRTNLSFRGMHCKVTVPPSRISIHHQELCSDARR